MVRGAVGLLVAITVVGCSRPAPRTTSPAPPPESERSGAALARVVVTNETSHTLAIAFRPATPPGGEVVVGRVGPGERTALAPVPAGEPIVLIARTPDRRELELSARTFPVDADWDWRIPADADFDEANR